MRTLFDVKFMLESIPDIVGFLPVTLVISVVAMFFGLLLGLAVALVKIYRIPLLKQLAFLFVSYVRGTPLLVQLYLCYYGIPIFVGYLNAVLGTQWSLMGVPAMVFVFFAYSINEAAYNSETLRSAILSVDKGQIEAAYSVGMSNFQALKQIVLPQAVKVALPNLGNNMISLIKGTSLAFAISVVEITARGQIVAARGYRFFEVFVVVAALYWGLTIAVEKLVYSLEKKFHAGVVGTDQGRG